VTGGTRQSPKRQSLPVDLVRDIVVRDIPDSVTVVMMRSAELSEPVIDRLRQIQLQQSVINADETPLKVIREDKTQCYMWVCYTGTDSPPEKKSQDNPPNIMIFDYQSSWGGHSAKDSLKNYQGYLQVDGYTGYEKTDVMLVGCFAHARRKIIEVQKSH
jgi:transposase